MRGFTANVATGVPASASPAKPRLAAVCAGGCRASWCPRTPPRTPGGQAPRAA